MHKFKQEIDIQIMMEYLQCQTSLQILFQLFIYYFSQNLLILQYKLFYQIPMQNTHTFLKNQFHIQRQLPNQKDQTLNLLITQIINDLKLHRQIQSERTHKYNTTNYPQPKIQHTRNYSDLNLKDEWEQYISNRMKNKTNIVNNKFKANPTAINKKNNQIIDKIHLNNKNKPNLITNSNNPHMQSQFYQIPYSYCQKCLNFSCKQCIQRLIIDKKRHNGIRKKVSMLGTIGNYKVLINQKGDMYDNMKEKQNEKKYEIENEKKIDYKQKLQRLNEQLSEQEKKDMDNQKNAINTRNDNKNRIIHNQNSKFLNLKYSKPNPILRQNILQLPNYPKDQTKKYILNYYSNNQIQSNIKDYKKNKKNSQHNPKIPKTQQQIQQRKLSVQTISIPVTDIVKTSASSGLLRANKIFLGTKIGFLLKKKEGDEVIEQLLLQNKQNIELRRKQNENILANIKNEQNNQFWDKVQQQQKLVKKKRRVRDGEKKKQQKQQQIQIKGWDHANNNFYEQDHFQSQ